VAEQTKLFNVNTFISTVNKNKGLVRPNKYWVEIPWMHRETKITIDPILCHSATLPGKAIEPMTYELGKGKEYQIASKISYENVDFSFYITNDKWFEREIFSDWIDYIIEPKKDYVRYKNGNAGYAKLITITCYNEHHDKSYSIELENAFPISINEVELSGEGHEPVSVTVNIAYDKWTRKT